MRLYACGIVCSKYFNCNYYVAYSSYMMRLSVNLLLLTLFVIVPRVQLGESLKTMIYADYPEQWPTLLRWVKHNLLDQQVYGILFVLRILSRKYACRLDQERTPIYHIVEETFPHLHNIFNRLVQIANPSIEVADLIKLICKIFWSSIYF